MVPPFLNVLVNTNPPNRFTTLRTPVRVARDGRGMISVSPLTNAQQKSILLMYDEGLPLRRSIADRWRTIPTNLWPDSTLHHWLLSLLIEVWRWLCHSFSFFLVQDVRGHFDDWVILLRRKVCRFRLAPRKRVGLFCHAAPLRLVTKAKAAVSRN
jgi:hypothetical protein